MHLVIGLLGEKVSISEDYIDMVIELIFTSFQQILLKTFFIIILGDIMKVKIFDEEDEKDLESDINDFLADLDGEVIDIKYQVSVGVFSEEQVFCFSAMIVYY